MRSRKLKSSNEFEDIDENYASPLISPGEVIVRESSGRDTAASLALTFGGGIKFLLGILAFILLIFITLYTFLAGTLMFAAPSSNSAMERIWVARGTFEGGNVNSGQTVYGSAAGPAADSFVGKFMEGYSGVQDYYVADVVAGPLGIVTSKDNQVLVDGKQVGITGSTKEIRLRDQYLATCVTGDSCEPGQLIIIDKDSIAGEVRGVLSTEGMVDIHER